MSMMEFKNKMAQNMFGISITDAWNQNICVDCKQPITEESFYSEMGRKEYSISGLCEHCADKIFKEK